MLLLGLAQVPLVFEGYGYPHHPVLGALLLVAFTMLASPLYVFLRMANPAATPINTKGCRLMTHVSARQRHQLREFFRLDCRAVRLTLKNVDARCCLTLS